jgi:hypothetical protein
MACTDGEIYPVRVEPITLTPETRAEILKCDLDGGDLHGWMASDFPEFNGVDGYLYIVGDVELIGYF